MLCVVTPDFSMLTGSDYFTEQCENTDCHGAGQCVTSGLCDCDEGKTGQCKIQTNYQCPFNVGPTS